MCSTLLSLVPRPGARGLGTRLLLSLAGRPARRSRRAGCPRRAPRTSDPRVHVPSITALFIAIVSCPHGNLAIWHFNPCISTISILVRKSLYSHSDVITATVFCQPSPIGGQNLLPLDLDHFSLTHKFTCSTLFYGTLGQTWHPKP